MNNETNFNEIIENLIGSAIAANAIRSELELHDSGYQLTISLIKVEDE